nr:hypothetical protein GCM10020241_51830 [Streptoalloteichus tenebrarius]
MAPLDRHPLARRERRRGPYEGAHYHRRGVYRPTENSLMRSLGRPFNLPGREAMTEAILRKSRGPAHAGTAAAR